MQTIQREFHIIIKSDCLVPESWLIYTVRIQCRLVTKTLDHEVALGQYHTSVFVGSFTCIDQPNSNTVGSGISL